MSMRFVGIQITTNCVQSRHTWQIVSPLAPTFSTSVRPSFPLPELSRHQGVIGSSSNLQHLSGQHATRLCIEISRTALGPCLSLGVFQRNHQRRQGDATTHFVAQGFAITLARKRRLTAWQKQVPTWRFSRKSAKDEEWAYFQVPKTKDTWELELEKYSWVWSPSSPRYTQIGCGCRPVPHCGSYPRRLETREDHPEEVPWLTANVWCPKWLCLKIWYPEIQGWILIFIIIFIHFPCKEWPFADIAYLHAQVIHDAPRSCGPRGHPSPLPARGGHRSQDPTCRDFLSEATSGTSGSSQ